MAVAGATLAHDQAGTVLATAQSDVAGDDEAARVTVLDHALRAAEVTVSTAAAAQRRTETIKGSADTSAGTADTAMSASLEELRGARAAIAAARQVCAAVALWFFVLTALFQLALIINLVPGQAFRLGYAAAEAISGASLIWRGQHLRATAIDERRWIKRFFCPGLTETQLQGVITTLLATSAVTAMIEVSYKI